MFKKIVIIEPINVFSETIEKLKELSTELIYYHDSIPQNNQEIIKRINNADAVLVSYTTPIDKEVLKSCKNIKYIGMCCSLYSEESATPSTVLVILA